MSVNKLPINEMIKDEAKYLKQSWSSGPFNFLLIRTIEKHSLRINSLRRSHLESLSGLSFPSFSDNQLKELYLLASQKYQAKCNSIYGASSGFYSTRHEEIFLRNLSQVIKENPLLRHLEIYPSIDHSKDLPPYFKMVIGNYVPDFVVFGIKSKNISAITLEIDGHSHLDKHEKDMNKSLQLEEMGIAQYEIQNDKVNDLNFIKSMLLERYKLRNGSFNDQIKRVKREIWMKTISCHLSLDEIESYCRIHFALELNLYEEAKLLINFKKCPRKIRKELLKLILRSA